MVFKELLKQKGISPYKLAKDLGISPQSVYRYIWGEREPSAATMLKLTEILNVSAQEILEMFVKMDKLKFEQERKKLREESAELSEILGKGKEHVCCKPARFEKEIIIKREWEDIPVKFQISWDRLEPIEWLKEAFQKAVKEFEDLLFGDF